MGRPFGVRGGAQPVPRLRSPHVEGAALGVAHERHAQVPVEPLRPGEIHPGPAPARGQVGVDLVHGPSVEPPFPPRLVVRPGEAHERNPHRRPVDHPRLVAPRLEDGMVPGRGLQRPPVRTAPDGVGRDQPDPLRPARAQLLTRLHEPVAHEVRLRRRAALEGREQPRHVALPQVRVEQLAAQERRVADHRIRRRPLRLPALLLRLPTVRRPVLRRQQRVAALDGVERLQDRVARFAEAVAPHPLDLADPHRHPGQLGGVGVDLQPPHVGRADRRERPLKPHRLGFQLHPVLQVLERVQRQVQEVARAAGGVEHREGAKPGEEPAQPPLRFAPEPRPRRLRPRRPRPLHARRDPRLHRLPFGEQGAHHHRLDEPHDLVPVGVVRAELRTLGRVQAALEQGPQDRGVDLRPVEGRRLAGGLDLGPFQRQRGIVVEQPAVEPRHRLEPDPAPGGHRPEQVPREGGELFGPSVGVLQHPGEHPVRQQAHVLGEHAEHEPVDEVRHRLGAVAAFAQRPGEPGEGRRRALGQRLPALARAQPLGVRHRPLELVPPRRVGEVVERELVGLAHAVRPVGADAEPHQVRDDEERRVLKGQRVLAELVEGRVEVRVPALVLPGEAVALPYVRPAVAAGVLARPALEAVALADRVGLRRGRLAEQPAQIDEMLLRGGALLEPRRRPPLGDERAGGHADGRAGSRPGRTGRPAWLLPCPLEFFGSTLAGCFTLFFTPGISRQTTQ